MSDETNKTEAEVILAAGASGVGIQGVDGHPVYVTPKGYEVHDLEHLLRRPTRKKGNATFYESISFTAYVNEHKTAGTRIWMDQKGNFEAVLDHHETEPEITDAGAPSGAGWGEHRARYTPEPTREWQRWIGKNKSRMNQVTFAEFIEEGLDEIIEPAGAVMLETAKRIEATSTVAFVSGIRLENGNQALRYEETTEARVGSKGELTVPSTFVVGMKIYEGAEPYRIEARLRYRIENKGLVLWYDLINPHLVIQDVLEQIKVEINSVTDIEVYSGVLNS